MSGSKYLCFEKKALTTSTYGTPLIATAKRYTRTNPSQNPDPKEPGVILLFGHGTGFLKELWEPVIEDLFRCADQEPQAEKRTRIREAWAMDCQNHGEAAIINQETLASKPGVLTIYDYADAFAKLYSSGLLGPFNPEIHKVVLVGHSAGAVGVILATSFFNPPSRIPFSSLILIEPAMYARSMEGKDTDMFEMVKAMTARRRDMWLSLDNARQWMETKLPWTTWDKRVFELYVKHGFQSLPTAYYPDKTEGVTLAAYKMDEQRAFEDMRHSFDALNRLNQICDFVPVHLIFGARNDLYAREAQDSIVNPSEGRNMASVTRIRGAGHLVVQETPKKLADAIWAILEEKQNASHTRSAVTSRL